MRELCRWSCKRERKEKGVRRSTEIIVSKSGLGASTKTTHFFVSSPFSHSFLLFFFPFFVLPPSQDCNFEDAVQLAQNLFDHLRQGFPQKEIDSLVQPPEKPLRMILYGLNSLIYFLTVIYPSNSKKNGSTTCKENGCTTCKENGSTTCQENGYTTCKVCVFLPFFFLVELRSYISVVF